MVEPGRRCLGGRYELDRLLATGGMGQVWRAVDTALHRPVAVKVLRSEYTSDATFLARFRAEAQHAASLNHPNTAAVFDYGEATVEDGSGETLAYLVMELVEGEPLSSLLAREGQLGTGVTLSILRQTAFALAEAHRAGLVHRDVKPGNIMVRPDGEVKITDFGIAWSARSVALTQTGQVIGTPQYLSPEAAEGRTVTPASDVYALGLIGYECLAGHPAFEGDNAVTIALKQVQQDPEPLSDELPDEIRDLIERAVAKDPAARFADGAMFVEAIEDVMAGRPLPASPSTVAVPHVATGARAGVPAPRAPGPATAAVSRPPARRRRSSLATLLLTLLGLLAGAGVAVGILTSLSPDQPTSTAVAADLQTRGGVVLDAEDYLGRPLGEVTDRLAALGLTVEPRAEVRTDAPPDAVTAIDPAGTPLLAGDRVTVTYAVTGSDGEPGPGATVVTGAADSAAVPAATDVPDPSEAEAPSEETSPAAAETSSEPVTSQPGAPTTDPSGSTTPGGTDAGSTTPGGTDAGSTTPGSTTPGSTTPGSTTPGSTSPGGTTAGGIPDGAEPGDAAGAPDDPDGATPGSGA